MAPKRNASCGPNDLTQRGRTQRRRTARQRAPPKLAQPLYKASIKKLAETNINNVHSSTANVDSAILLRIKRCLDRANHPTTPEPEARTAICMASRLMGQYNVSQAEVLAHEPVSTQKQYGGKSDVQILRSDGDKSKLVRHQNYVNTLGWAMTTFFDCKYYSVGHRSSLVLCFYGIVENTIAAAMGFEMVYNLIGEWARPYKGVGRKNSYALGVCDEMYSIAKQKQEKELTEARNAEEEATASELRQEEAERQEQLNRLHSSPFGSDESSYTWLEEYYRNTGVIGSSHAHSTPAGGDSGLLFLGYGCLIPNGLGDNEDSEDDADSYISDDCTEPDFEIQENESDTSWDQVESGNSTSIGKLEPAVEEISAASTGSEPEPEPENKWASQMQLQLFRETASNIADEYLKECGIKLGKGKRGRKNVIRDRDAYNQGVEDSKKIDLDRKRLTE
ncbi:hypothetical protein V494_00534 [Pseudogymnoascus sp. VKM F-4513 (FW-928)]|nr:hypothetical protein V494_00534 [Pseudogymnoascus sp. VKM F-4513 (FW-928)]